MFFRRILLVRMLLAAAAVALLGLYGYFYAREGLAKWAFAHRTYFAADELIRIAVAQTDLTTQTAYLLTEGEFDWQGNMVDVLHREVRPDSIIVYGFRDEAETELRQEAAWLYPASDKDRPLTDAGAKRAKWFSPFILPDPVGVLPVVRFSLPGLQLSFSYTPPHIGHPLLDVLSPPPNQVIGYAM